MVYPAWDQQQETRLRRLFADGKSAQMIANEMHRSRNSVLGKLNRLDLHRVTAPIVTKMRQAPIHKPIPQIATAPAAPRKVAPVPFLKLKWFHCRAPLPDRGADGLAMFCGAVKQKGSPWCPRHRRLFVIPRGSA